VNGVPGDGQERMLDLHDGPSSYPPIAEYAFLSDCETSALVAPSGNI
jgi:hypothetical protein